MSPSPGLEPTGGIGPLRDDTRAYVVSAIIPTFNAKRFLDSCLASVLAAAEHHGAVEVIVVDNGSTDGTWGEVQLRQCEWVRALQAPGVTVAAVRNRGAELARGRYFAFIDSDCEVGREYFREVERSLSSGDWVASGSLCALPPSPHWIERVWHRLHQQGPNPRPKYINGANLVVTREAFCRVGGFQEALITDEDVDFCARLVNHGFRFKEDPHIAAVHHGNPRSLRAFVRREAWHSIGSRRRGAAKLDKPTAMALTHLICGAATLAAALFGSWLSAPARVLLAVGGQTLMPLLAVLYRLMQGGKLENLPAALLLYHLYFDARGVVTLAALVDRHHAANMLRGSAIADESEGSPPRSSPAS